ncbi:helix-turn-helix transcriptional regulator [Glutamicibacter sp.]|uniref:helix-turn-helix transcriptional regulator n=1 Tax=Glutamicibacter sp. TaxID=1931995 RepID=UPI002B4862A5|nr:helix-turn-helix transcriptional regulator [Glutamicibacter sp.]HJX80212.1 helix-turn-helix transcriptional regulator [Glutamicibacter sp.]
MIKPRGISRASSPEYNELLHVLRHPGSGGALILGGLGMGKTSLVEAVLSASGIQRPVMTLFCSESLSSVAHGALSPYLGALDSIDEPVAVLRELNRTLFSADRATRSHIVLVEDAQYLDAQSCFVLSLLIENAAVKLIAVGAGTLDANSPLGTLSEVASLSTIVMQPLDLRGVREVAEEIIDGRLSDGSVRIIERMTRGNPRFVEAYTASCKDQGILFQDDSLLKDSTVHEPVWIIARPLPEIDARLRSLGRELTRYLPMEEQLTLRLLALGGPQRPELLDECSLPYRRLVDAGDLAVVDGAIALRSEMQQRVVRELVTEQQSAQLHELWSTAGAKLKIEANALEVLWSLEIGEPVPAATVLQIAQETASALDYALALRLCTLGKLSQLHEQGALLEAQVLLGMGRYYAARALLLRLIDQLTDLEILGQAFAYLLEVTTCIGMDRSELQKILGTWESRAEGQDDPLAVEAFLALQKAGAGVLDLWIRVNSAKGPRPSAQELHNFLEDPDLPIQARIISMITLSDLYSSQGLCSDALQLAESAMEILQAQTQLRSLYEVRVFFRIGWNLLFLGEYRRAKQFINEYRGTELNSIQHYQGVVSLLDGISDLLQSRVRPAISKIAEAVTELRIVDTAQVLAVATNLYRLLLARLGTPVPAAVAFGTVDDVAGGYSAVPGYLGEEASEQRIFPRAFAAALGNPHEGESIGDFPLVEREILYSQTRQLSDEEMANSPQRERLCLLAGEHQGSRPALLARLMQLLGAANSEPLEDLAAQALAKEEYLVAIEAMARAAEQYAAAGDQRRCGALLRRTAKILEQHGLDSGKYIARILALTELTAREAEIVELARAGRNNAQIARALTVSQRTVEGHLYRVFSKLGITERSALNNAGLQAGTGTR